MKNVRQNGIDYETWSAGQWLLKRLADPWKNFLIPTAWLRRLTLRSRSPLIAETVRSPGCWEAMEIIYRNDHPVDYLDRQALRDNPLSMAARNRRRFVVHELARLMRHYSAQPVINVLGVGAGPGLQVQDAFCQSGLDPEQLAAYFIDRDSGAFRHGLERAAECGLAGSTHYICGDAMQLQTLLPDCRFHIAKLIGIIEYLDDDSVVALARIIRGAMHPDGTLLTHGIVDTHKAMPFLERVFQLKLVQRSGEQIRCLLSAAGFQNLRVTEIPLRIYPMIEGTAG